MQPLETKPLLVDISHITLRLTHAEFEQLCQDNPDMRFELTAIGELITMAPAGIDRELNYLTNKSIAHHTRWRSLSRGESHSHNRSWFCLCNSISISQVNTKQNPPTPLGSIANSLKFSPY
jgi:Uma2 family endonuclease